MLSKPRSSLRRRQSGVVLMVALIVLIAMTLAGLALVRSVDTANMVAGNLAFQQAATHSGDAGAEKAITWLQANSGGSTLWTSNLPEGYAANRQDPVAGQTWDSFWNNVLVPAGQVVALPQDAAGNTVSYAIQRLCNAPGDPVAVGTGCAQMQNAGSSSGSSKGAGVVALQYTGQYYYRITVRIAGPRNTVGFIQTVVSM